MERILKILLGVLYPFLVYGALKYFSPRWVGLLIVLVMVFRHRQQTSLLWQGLAQPQKWTFYLLVASGFSVSLLNSEMLLRIFPVLISLSMLFLFTYTLYHPPAMIERFARLTHPDLPPEGVAYTRLVTQVWCGFFLINAGISLITSLYGSRETWVLYNGLISYVLIGTLMAGEWLYRFWRFPESRLKKSSHLDVITRLRKD